MKWTIDLTCLYKSRMYKFIHNIILSLLNTLWFRLRQQIDIF